MAKLSTFYTVKGLNLSDVKNDINIPVIREPLVPKSNKNIESRFDIVMAPDKNSTFKRIDEVPRKRPFIKFAEVHDWITSEFDRVGLEYKLRKSSLEIRKMSLYQEYIFNKEVSTPDGEGIAPMVLLKASYSRSGSPLELNLGTYRFTCANGAIVTVGSMTTIKITETNITMFTKQGFHKMFIQAFEQYDKVSKLYSTLAQIKAIDVFDSLFSNKILSLRLRKGVLEKMENKNHIFIIRDFKDPMMNKAMLKAKYLTREMLEEPKASITLTHQNISLWDVYNDFTELVTHNNKTSSEMLSGSKAVNMVFQILVKERF